MRMRVKRYAAALAAAVTIAAGGAGVARASTVDTTAVVDAVAPVSEVTLAPGGTSAITITLEVTGKQDSLAYFSVHRDWLLSGGAFTGSNPQTFSVPAQSPGTKTTFQTTGTVSVAAGQGAGSFTANVGAFGIINAGQTAKLGAGASATYTVHVTAPTNTRPVVRVTGVSEQQFFEVGYDADPVPMCAVTDDHDVVTPFAATIIDYRTPQGLGSLYAVCNYTDQGGLAASTAVVTYHFVDLHNPTISHTLSAVPNVNGWFKDDVTVTFVCADEPGSGIKSCLVDGTDSPSVTLGEGADQSVTGTATDWSIRTAHDTVSGINIDKTAPTVSLTGPAGQYYYGDSLPATTCDATDALSGIDGNCSVMRTREDGAAAGDGTAVGTYTVTATASDKAGNTTTQTQSYTVLAWTPLGFYRPVDMDDVNTVKAGSTVPLKFEVFVGATELTSTSVVRSFTVTRYTVNPSADGEEVPISEMATGATNLRYDATGGQFVQNWKTPKTPGVSYKVTVTLQDGSTITALFRLK